MSTHRGQRPISFVFSLVFTTLVATAGCDAFNSYGNQWPGTGGTAPATATDEAACSSDNRDPPPGESWWECYCGVHLRVPPSRGAPLVPGPPTGNGMGYRLKVPAKSAIDASVKVQNEFATVPVLKFRYLLDRVAWCIPYVPGSPHKGPWHVEDLTTGICALSPPAPDVESCHEPGWGCDNGMDSACCSGVCVESMASAATWGSCQ